MEEEVVEKLVEKLQEDVRELSLGTTSRVERSDGPPLGFLRDFVSPNKPCVISNATLHWPALTSWTQDESYLYRTLSEAIVSVHLTPDGQDDALVPGPRPSSSSLCFASAHVERMTFPDALQHISSSGSSSSSSDPPFVAYAQEQKCRTIVSAWNTQLFPLMWRHTSRGPWATEALGCLPEAVNLWIGNHHSTTSLHKDHYENLYAVISGEKHFLLLPPTDVHRLYIHNYPAAHCSFSQDTGDFTLQLEEPLRYVPWCSVDPYPPSVTEDQDISKFPLYFNGPKPFECTVKAGEILYLPSMWFHHVKQSPDNKGRTIAINYWYDMQFDIKYAYFNLLQSIPYPLSSESTSLGNECDDQASDAAKCNVDATELHASSTKHGNR